MLVDAEEYGTAERNAAIVMGIAVDKRRVLADERATSTDHNVALRWLKGEAARVLSEGGARETVALVEEREDGELVDAGRGDPHAGEEMGVAVSTDTQKYLAK